MTMQLHIEGMSCGHCTARVEKALNAIQGISAKVDLASKTATIESAGEINRAILEEAVSKAGYTVN